MPYPVTRTLKPIVAPERIVTKSQASSDEVLSSANRFNYGTQNMEPYVDAFRRRRAPTARELLAQYKNTAYACVNINASTCAANLPKLYVKQSPGLPIPKCHHVPAPEKTHWAREHGLITKSEEYLAVPAHPLIDLFSTANPVMGTWDIFFLLHAYLEIFGIAYWWMKPSPLFGTPEAIIPLQVQQTEPQWDYGTQDLDILQMMTPTHYRSHVNIGNSYKQLDIPAEQVVVFRFVDPNNPFQGGYSPMRAAVENCILNSEYIAHRQALWENRARPDCIVSPEEYVGEHEMRRLEREYNQKFKRAGMGRAYFPDFPVNVSPLHFSQGDAVSQSEHYMTKEDICNVFGVPMAFVTTDVNLSNIAGSESPYYRRTVAPRLYMRDQVLTETLCRLFDPTGRLCFYTEDPTPEDLVAKREQERSDLEHGVRTINEVRADNGMPPVEWGILPWLPTHFAPADMWLTFEERRDGRYVMNDKAEAMQGNRTRQRVEDMNNPSPPMRQYRTDLFKGSKLK